MAHKRFVPTIERYVSVEAFTKNLYRLNRFSRASTWESSSGLGLQPLNVGVCVSGGPDSMALAYLLQTTPRLYRPDLRAFSLHCFVVDHGARAQSQDEALQVKEALQKLGLRATVLKLKWPTGVDPSEMHGFEAAARQARYRIIVGNALRQQCYDLFTGHHQDDQMETVLLRMIRNINTNLLGLQGMADTSAVPCSNDIVDATSFLTQPPWKSERTTSANFLTNSEKVNQGMQLHRPLLPFTKQQLIKTCQHFGVPYVIDKTNLDATHNVRNAVRYLRSRSLPKALQSAELTALRERACGFAQNLEHDAINLLKGGVHLRTHSQFGAVEMTIKDRRVYTDMLAFRYLLARVLELVSPLAPEQQQTISNLEPALLLAEHCLSKSSVSPTGSMYAPIVTCKVLIQPLLSADKARSYYQQLILYRQPMRRSEVKFNALTFALDGIGSEYNAQQTHRSKFLLWDNRFWIRIFSKDANIIETTEVRALRETDVPKMKRKQSQESVLHRFFDNNVLPEKIKFSLPVLTTNGLIVALPTLETPREDTPHNLAWEVRYPRSNRTSNLLASTIDTKLSSNNIDKT